MKSWHVSAGLMIAVLFLWATPGQSGPVKGRGVKTIEVPAFPPEKWEKVYEFRGGERACCIVLGDRNPVVDLSLEVRDAKGNVVAKDAGKGDLVSAIWYPPEDGNYTITVTNPSQVLNKCLFVVR